MKPETIEMLILGRYLLKDLVETTVGEGLPRAAGGAALRADKELDLESLLDLEARFQEMGIEL